jgi:tetratricopeptide (TPR) repeat protein
LDQAIADHGQAISIDPQFALAYTNRGTAHFDKGDLVQAMADYEKSLALGAADAVTYYVCGHLHAEFGEREEAIADFTSALALGLSPELKQDAVQMLDELGK